MSSSVPSFFIGYAMSTCTEAQVTEVFNSVLGDVVDTVKSSEKADYHTGKPFKIFWVNLKKTNDVVDRIVERLKKEEFVKIDYDNGWYWKVTINKPKVIQSEKTKSAPRIMEHNE